MTIALQMGWTSVIRMSPGTKMDLNRRPVDKVIQWWKMIVT